MPKQARLRGIKGARCYTIEEAADVSGVSPRTIRNWGKEGLPVMDSARPILIRGDDLRAHIEGKRKANKVRTALDTFYCMACRKARPAAGGFADCTLTGDRATLTALCDHCGTLLTKPVAQAQIPKIARLIDLTIKRQE